MFYGAVVKPGQSVEVPSENGEILHISQACLGPKASEKAKAFLQITHDNNTYNLCRLIRNACEHASFDIFIPTTAGITFTTVGDAEIHVTGYFEPEGDQTGLNFGEDDSDEESEEAEEEVPSLDDAELEEAANSLPLKRLAQLMPDKARAKGLKLAEMMKGKSHAAPSSSEEEADSDAEENALPAAEMAGSGDESDEDSDEDMDEEAVMQAIANAQKTSVVKAPPAKVAEKRNAPSSDAAQPKKKQKKSDTAVPHPVATKAAPVASGDDTKKFQQSLVEYIKAHGRCGISNLGSQVKRPTSVKKLGAFIKERPTVFKMEGEFVSLMK